MGLRRTGAGEPRPRVHQDMFTRSRLQSNLPKLNLPRSPDREREQHGDEQEQLLKKADLALYRSKAAGRNCYTLYDEAMSAELEARNTLEGDLRDAIARCHFEVHYQPLVDLSDG